MILYSLACNAGHHFDSWFRDSATYEDQTADDLVTCPVCRSVHVTKAIMSPMVVGARKPAPASAGSTEYKDIITETTTDVALLDPRSRELRALIKAVREKVIAEGQDVGARFPDEARRMHDGETPVRQIYGQASLAEARDLLEDGIMVLPLPSIPDDLN